MSNVRVHGPWVTAVPVRQPQKVVCRTAARNETTQSPSRIPFAPARQRPPEGAAILSPGGAVPPIRSIPVTSMTFYPQDPDFDRRVQASFARQQVMTTLGVEISRLSPGAIELTMPYAAAYTQQHGFVHAGIVATALDSACGYAAFSLMPANAGVLTVEFKTSLLAPARGQRFIFQAQVLKPGKTLTFCEARALAQDGDAEPRLVASMSATLMAIYDRPGITH
jgi:uncharacterized protein (TIGR00369 family)